MNKNVYKKKTENYIPLILYRFNWRKNQNIATILVSIPDKYIKQTTWECKMISLFLYWQEMPAIIYTNIFYCWIGQQDYQILTLALDTLEMVYKAAVWCNMSKFLIWSENLQIIWAWLKDLTLKV